MTEPLTPAGCDLRDFPRLMIDIPRLFASGFNATASRNPLAWMIGHKLWYRSWHQVPAGSLPNDDAELCHLAELGFDERTFRKAKTIAMRGWIECDDGRLYHPVVCEAALEAWQEKLRQRLASRSGNAKRWGLEFDPQSVAQEFKDLIACLERLCPSSKSIQKAQKSLAQCDTSDIPVGTESDPTGIGPASHRDNETPEKSSLGTGTGTGIKEEEESFALVAGATKAMSKPEYPDAFEAAWRAYPHVHGRSSKPKALAEWRRLEPEDRDELPAMIERFKPRVGEVCGDRGAPCMARWLKDGKHLNWRADQGAKPISREVWEQLVAMWQRGEGWPNTVGPEPDQPGARVPRELLITTPLTAKAA